MGKFHERLYHYLSEGRLELPALRERVGDILSLAEYFLGIYSQRLSLPVPLISESAQRALEASQLAGQYPRAGGMSFTLPCWSAAATRFCRST